MPASACLKRSIQSRRVTKASHAPLLVVSKAPKVPAVVLAVEVGKLVEHVLPTTVAPAVPTPIPAPASSLLPPRKVEYSRADPVEFNFVMKG